MIKNILVTAVSIVAVAATVHIICDEFDAAVSGDQGLIKACDKAWDALAERCKNERMNDWEKRNLINELYAQQSKSIIAQESNVYRNVKARTYNTARYNIARATF